MRDKRDGEEEERNCGVLLSEVYKRQNDNK